MKPFNSVQTTNSSTWNNLTVCKQISSGSCKNNVTNKLFVHKLYIYIYIKLDLVLNNLLGSIYQKTQPTNEPNKVKDGKNSECRFSMKIDGHIKI